MVAILTNIMYRTVFRLARSNAARDFDRPAAAERSVVPVQPGSSAVCGQNIAGTHVIGGFNCVAHRDKLDVL